MEGLRRGCHMIEVLSRRAPVLFLLLFVAAASWSASAAPVPQPAPTSPPAPIATSDGQSPGTRVEVTELKRGSGGILSLKFQMINDSDKSVSFGFDFASADAGNVDFKTIGGVTLVDPVGKKKYFVVRDTEKKCVCSSGLEEVPKGSRLNLWAKFPAPPDDVNKIGILIPHFTPMDDVPITK
jgi:hypothetical protein